MRRFALLLPLLAVACATGPTLDQRLATFVGQGEGELVSNLGVPVRTYETDGRKFLQFESQRTVALLGSPYGYGPGFGGGFYGRRGGYFGGGGFAPTTYASVSCDVTFALRNDRVESFTYRGEGCA